ncbi:hypothetical protein ACYT7O_10920, partial [Streptococcus pyogenes]
DLSNQIINIDYKNEDLYLRLDEIYCGGNVIQLLKDNEFTKNICKGDIINFQQHCLQFYIESLDQIKTRFPFEDPQQQKIKS